VETEILVPPEGKCRDTRIRHDSTNSLDVVVLTHFASPYQVELFDATARHLGAGFAVYYLHRTHPTRNWRGAEPKHTAHFFNDEPAVLQCARRDFATARLAVFNTYSEKPAPALLKLRERSRKPWCFWGERPGYRFAGVFGRLYRSWKLQLVHQASGPIWGIGRFAVEGYRSEFGNHRRYINLPYFSDLGRFGCAERPTSARPRTLLFSGSLTRRKGVDVLASAFKALAALHPTVRLKIMGDGPLERALRLQLGALGKRVEFLGFRDWSELPAIYAGADVLCVPSRYDGWGLVVPEGLAAGLPVIATNRMGAALDLVQNGLNGWIVPAGDEAALGTALRSAASLSDERLGEFSKAAHESVASHSLEDGAQRFLAAAYETVARWRG
jgi:glycosyltransferase involved in cell wall biosynthesis